MSPNFRIAKIASVSVAIAIACTPDCQRSLLRSDTPLKTFTLGLFRRTIRILRRQDLRGEQNTDDRIVVLQRWTGDRPRRAPRGKTNGGAELYVQCPLGWS
ncbi:hypothetical protein BPSY_2212 [Bifidobacterium psychraerophilum]|uniref:Uncharacterized protein n=1 Tax=Bifidobacterium psychraerophilum TaxID=218140 RepID=A0A087CIZ3_9BIFI|nr:hypothetical protein BPSY_2212 [Bifidobacterium psychraerophilum]